MLGWANHGTESGTKSGGLVPRAEHRMIGSPDGRSPWPRCRRSAPGGGAESVGWGLNGREAHEVLTTYLSCPDLTCFGPVCRGAGPCGGVQERLEAAQLP